MINKKYVVITTAPRARLEEEYSPPKAINATATPYDYRKGHLGLLHPQIAEYFRNYSGHLKGSLQKIDIMEWYTQKRGPKIISLSNLLEPFEPHSEDIPILFHGEYFWPACGEEYVIGHFRRGEFAELEGLDLDSVKEQFTQTHAERGINIFAVQKNLENYVESQWLELEEFQHFSPSLIDTIPIEVTMRKISPENILSVQEFLKESYKFELNHRELNYRPPKITSC